MRYTLFILLILLISSCSVNRESALNSPKVMAGMSKDQIIERVGNPYKTGFSYNDDNKLVDELYYKELIYKNYRFYEVITLLTFLDNRLISNQLISDVQVDNNSHDH